jgi:hypothetical protein
MLGEALGLHNDDAHFVIFHDLATGQEFIRSSRQLHEQGMYVELGAYKCHVFMDIREVVNDVEHPYAEVNARLSGRGAPSIERELKLLQLTPVTSAFERLVNGETLQALIVAAQPKSGAKSGAKSAKERSALLEDVEARLTTLLQAVVQCTSGKEDPIATANLASAIRADVEVVLGLGKKTAQAASGITTGDTATWATLLGWLLTRRLGEVASRSDGAALSAQWLNEWELGDGLRNGFRQLGLDDAQAWQAMMRIKVMPHRAMLDVSAPSPQPARRRAKSQTTASNPVAPAVTDELKALFDDSDAKALLQANEHEGATYFNKEAFDALMQSFAAGRAFDALSDASLGAAQQVAVMRLARTGAAEAISRAAAAEYQVEKVLDVPLPEAVAP